MQLRLAVPAPDTSRAHLAELRPKQLKLWLERLPLGNLQESAQALLLSLAALNRQPLADDARLKLLTCYRDTLHSVVDTIKLQIAGLSLPLADKPRQLAMLTRELLVELAHGYKLVLLANSNRLLGFGSRHDQIECIQRILSAQLRLLVLSYESYAAIPNGLWLEIHQLHTYASTLNKQGAGLTDTPLANVNQLYRLALLLAAADPYRLSPGEVNKILDLARTYGELAQIQSAAPPDQLDGFFLLQRDSDLPPLTMPRQASTRTAHGEYYLNTLALARQISHLLACLRAGEAPDQLGLPAYASETAYQGLLQRLLRSWGASPSRIFNRQEGNRDEIELCSGIRAIHACLNAARTAGDTNSATEIAIDVPYARTAGEPGLSASNWKVVNDSAGGMALQRQNSPPVQQQVGEVVALRTLARTHTHLGIVRWIRNAPAARIEIGIQMLPPNPQAVMVRNSLGKIRTPQPAILMPANASLKLPRQLLVPRGIYAPNMPITLGIENGQRILPTRIIEHSHAFDLFEFEEQPDSN
jgi:hypothetical protein